MIDDLKYALKLAKLKVTNEVVSDFEIGWCHPYQLVQQLTELASTLSYEDCQCVLILLKLQDTRSEFINYALTEAGISLTDYAASMVKLKHLGLIDYKITKTPARQIRLLR